MSPTTSGPDHTLSSRPPTEKEREVVVGQTQAYRGSFGCLLLIGGIAPALMFGLFGGWVIGSIAGAVVFLWGLFQLAPFERRLHRRAVLDANDQIVQEITVRDPRVLEVDAIGDNDPALALDIGQGRILVLQGQWLRDPAIYGAPALEGDPEEELLNGLPAPWSFPSTSFVLTRLPHSGRVLGIRVAGEYSPPEKEIDVLRPEYEFGDSELFEGDLERISDVLEREHAARFPTQT